MEAAEHLQRGQRDPQAGVRAAREGEQKALAEHLADHRRPTRAAPCGARTPPVVWSPHQQQVGHVGAGDEQHHSHRAEDEQRRAGVLHHVVVQRDGADSRRFDAACSLNSERNCSAIEFISACACSMVTFGASRPNTVKKVSSVAAARRSRTGSEPRVAVGDLERLLGQYGLKSRERDADHLVGAVDLDRLPDQRGIAGVAALPAVAPASPRGGPVHHFLLGEEVASNAGRTPRSRKKLAVTVTTSARSARPHR